jgi:hypothetical protein
MKRLYEMAPKYVLINEVARDRYEKKWQIPFGYGLCPTTTNSITAVQWLKQMNELGVDTSQLIIEKVSVDGRETFYRI